jgi:hypothetical protein
MMITIETRTEVSTSMLGDVAITAAEGGIGDWAQIDTYRPSRWTSFDYTGDNTEVPEDFVFYRIAVLDDDEVRFGWEDKDKVFDITPAVLARGIGLFMRADHFDDPTDLAAMDADEASAVVQYGIFGEVRYG